MEIDHCILNHLLSFFVEQVHLDYLEAGADVIITASYQVSVESPINDNCSMYSQRNLNVELYAHRPQFRVLWPKAFQ